MKSVFTNNDLFLPVGDHSIPYPDYLCKTHERTKEVFLTKDDGYVIIDETYEPHICEGKAIITEALLRRPDGVVIISPSTIKQ